MAHQLRRQGRGKDSGGRGPKEYSLGEQTQPHSPVGMPDPPIGKPEQASWTASPTRGLTAEARGAATTLQPAEQRLQSHKVIKMR